MRIARPIFCLPLLALATASFGAGPATLPGGKTETIAYLGVATSTAPPALRTQLGLQPGTGVVVDNVDADGPAAAAGVAVHDVITRLDDQVAVNVQQFGVLVRLKPIGQTVQLGVVRGGRPLTLSVTLGGRIVPTAEDVQIPLPPRGGRLSSIVQHTDAQHSITLTTHGDDRHVHIVDPAGTLVFDGPLNTPDDAARMPADCRQKVETLLKNFELFKRLRSTSNPSN